jgi:diguanylate cyclase (GGDEF)-like protein
MKNGKSSIRRKTTFIVIIMTLALTLVITFASILILGIYNNGKNSALFFILVILGVGALFAGVISYILDRSVISRLEVVYQAIRKIREDKDLTVRIEMPGNDELSNLAGGINETMQALESSEVALKENQARLAYDASHDALTGFPNRAYFTERLNQAIANFESQPGYQAAVLFADLDGFKLINDSYDHQFGDRVLIAFGHRLKRCLRTQDFVARLGGDEFAILLENIHSLADATRVAERLLDEVKKPFELGGRLVFQTVSVGIALTKAGIRGDELLRNADMAMYHAKESGKACFAIFDEDMHNQTISRLNLETELRRAVEREEFTIYYQPIVSMFDGEVTSLEALIRWKHPVHGLLLPDRFLNVAKETGLMSQINVFLFHSAIQQIKCWRESGLPELRVALNVSVRTLSEESFFELLQVELAQADVPASAIQIEVVESEMAANIDHTMDSLARLEKLGVAISVDDFGTGYSSLAYLKRLPIHSLKIDRTFIKDVIQDRDGAAIVSAMIVMAHVLGLDVVAEGVETESQFRFLLDQSCENAQGYLLSYPQPAPAITELLKSGRRLLPESEL